MLFGFARVILSTLITLSSDDNALLDNVNIASQSSIGEIQIRVKRISGLTPIRVPYSKNDYPLLPIQTIHETRVKTSKALHQIACVSFTFVTGASRIELQTWQCHIKDSTRETQRHLQIHRTRNFGYVHFQV